MATLYAVFKNHLYVFDPGPYRAKLAGLATYRRKGRLPKGTDRLARFYRSEASYIAVPRGILRHLEPLGIKVYDRRLLLPAVNFGWRGQLRPEQAAAARTLAMAGGGMLVALPGAGKTEMGMATVAALQQPALWLVNSINLAEEALKRARKLFNLPPSAYGYIGEGVWRIGTHLTVGLYQSIARGGHDGFELRFGQIWADEADLVAALTFSQAVSQFPARYRGGLTATPERTDGLGPLVRDIIGGRLVAIPRKVLVSLGRVMVPRVRIVNTGFRYWGSGQWADLQRTRAADTNRNILAVRLIQRDFQQGHRILALVEYVSHARLLTKMLRSLGIPAFAAVGPVSPKHRERALAQSASGQGVVVATKLADRGLDYPAMDRLHLVTPGKSLPRLEQQTGRVARIFAGKEDAVIYDYADWHVPALAKQAKARLEWYRREGFRGV